MQMWNNKEKNNQERKTKKEQLARQRIKKDLSFREKYEELIRQERKQRNATGTNTQLTHSYIRSCVTEVSPKVSHNLHISHTQC